MKKEVRLPVYPGDKEEVTAEQYIAALDPEDREFLKNGMRTFLSKYTDAKIEIDDAFLADYMTETRLKKTHLMNKHDRDLAISQIIFEMANERGLLTEIH